jgi:hypothetical protein
MPREEGSDQDQKGSVKSCLGSLISYYVVPRRLEDRIRALSDRAVSTTDPDELSKVHQQLRTLLSEHMRRLRKLMATHPVPTERRHPR